MSSLKVGQPLSDEELGEIERSLFGKLRAHRLSDSFIERWGEEAVQKGLVEYLRALDRGVEVENREAFVVQAAFLRAIDEVRREARLADGTEIEAFFDAGVLAEPATEELAVDHLAAGELHTAIESLPPEQRQALRLHYFDGLSAEEGAKALYCSERTYRRRLAKALRGLSRRLGVPVPEPGSGLAIEIGLAAWVSLRGADVALARGLLSPLSGVLDRGREGMAWLLDRLREPAARLGDGSGERLGIDRQRAGQGGRRLRRRRRGLRDRRRRGDRGRRWDQQPDPSSEPPTPARPARCHQTAAGRARCRVPGLPASAAVRSGRLDLHGREAPAESRGPPAPGPEGRRKAGRRTDVGDVPRGQRSLARTELDRRKLRHLRRRNRDRHAIWRQLLVFQRERRRTGRTPIRSVQMRAPARGSASLTLVIVAACLLCLPAFAEAAPSKFVSEQCDPQLPGGAPPSANFVGTPGGPFTPFQNCASPGGAIGITETGSASNDVRILVRHRPGDARRLRRIAGDLRARLRARAGERPHPRLRTGLADQLRC